MMQFESSSMKTVLRQGVIHCDYCVLAGQKLFYSLFIFCRAIFSSFKGKCHLSASFPGHPGWAGTR